MLLLFLSGGLFLGWSLGANDAANVFGSAVGSGMIRFRKAAIVCSIFVIAGAVIQGNGGVETLNSLGSTGSLQNAFLLTLSAALTVFGMASLGIPVSTSQAIVGAIIGWNIYSGVDTDPVVLRKIFLSWMFCPLLAALFSMFLYMLLKQYLKRSYVHLLKQDILLRWGLILIGAFGSYSLGANNIANVMGVFIPAAGFGDLQIGPLTLTGTTLLFFLGSLAIALGVFTFSGRTMKTIGRKLFKLTPEAALIVVLSHSLVLFIFSSTALNEFITGLGLPPLPLVPVSSSQAIVGAIIGIGLMRGGYGINFKVLGEIGLCWMVTPVVSSILAYVLLMI